jgi:hypothetical protein
MNGISTPLLTTATSANLFLQHEKRDEQRFIAEKEGSEKRKQMQTRRVGDGRKVGSVEDEDLRVRVEQVGDGYEAG